MIMSTITEKAESVAAFTALFLIGIGIVQVILGEVISKSVALTANGIDCIGDGFVSSVVWVGLKYFKRPADHKFHYGYYKIENLASIAAAIVMFVLAAYIIYRSYLQFTQPHEIKVPILGAVIALIAAVVAVILGLIKYSEGKETNLGSLKLEAFNTIKDGTASGLTVIALIISSFGILVADAIVGFIISGIIVTIGFAAIKEASYTLIDGCDQSCLDHQQIIRTIVHDLDEVKAAHVIRLRRTGPVIQGEMEVEVRSDMTIAELDEVKSEVQQIIKEAIPELERITITAIPFKQEQSELTE